MRGGDQQSEARQESSPVLYAARPPSAIRHPADLGAYVKCPTPTCLTRNRLPAARAETAHAGKDLRLAMTKPCPAAFTSSFRNCRKTHRLDENSNPPSPSGTPLDLAPSTTRTELGHGKRDVHLRSTHPSSRSHG